MPSSSNMIAAAASTTPSALQLDRESPAVPGYLEDAVYRGRGVELPRHLLEALLSLPDGPLTGPVLLLFLLWIELPHRIRQHVVDSRSPQTGDYLPILAFLADVLRLAGGLRFLDAVGAPVLHQGFHVLRWDIAGIDNAQHLCFLTFYFIGEGLRDRGPHLFQQHLALACGKASEELVIIGLVTFCFLLFRHSSLSPCSPRFLASIIPSMLSFHDSECHAPQHHGKRSPRETLVPTATGRCSSISYRDGFNNLTRSICWATPWDTMSASCVPNAYS